MANQLRHLFPEATPVVVPWDPPAEPVERPRATVVVPPARGPGVDLDSLRCFDAVATTLRFRTAAARVHLSPAALSDRIRRLEESLGAQILRRTTRTVSLTETGQRLLPLARRILSLADSMSAVVHGDATPVPYELILGTRYEVGLSWLCETLGPLARKRPERTLHLYNGSSADLLSGIERGDLDAAVVSMRLSSPRLTYAALHTEEYALVGVDRRLASRQDASRLTLVDIGPDLPLFRYFMDAQPDAEPWTFARVEYMGGIANVRHRLMEGEGRVGVLPTFFIKQDLVKRRLVKLMPRVHLRSDTLRLVWRSGHPRHTELIDLARDLRAFPLR